VPDLWTDTFLNYLIYGFKRHYLDNNDFALEEDILILPPINRIHSDLYGKEKGYVLALGLN
jgi:hypothetical protein